MKVTFAHWMLAAVLAVPAAAQTESQARSGGEVFGFGGGYFGEGGVNAPVGGGGLAYRAGNLRMFGEAFYLRKTLDAGFTSATGTATAFQGGVHILIPVGSSMAVPFGSASFGMARSSASAGSFSLSETLGQLGLGGGVDLNISPKWGIRPEFRLYNFVEYRTTFGVFYRF